jgi:hypothetical protein
VILAAALHALDSNKTRRLTPLRPTSTFRALASPDGFWVGGWVAADAGGTSRAACISACRSGRISRSARAHSSRTYSRHVLTGTKWGKRPSGLNRGGSRMSELCRVARDTRVALAAAAVAAQTTAPAGPAPPPPPAPAMMAGTDPVAATTGGRGLAPAGGGACALRRTAAAAGG